MYFSEKRRRSDRRDPGAPFSFVIYRKTAGNYNKLFSDENKCIKIEITIDRIVGRTKTFLHSYGKRKRK